MKSLEQRWELAKESTEKLSRFLIGLVNSYDHRVEDEKGRKGLFEMIGHLKKARENMDHDWLTDEDKEKTIEMLNELLADFALMYTQLELKEQH